MVTRLLFPRRRLVVALALMMLILSACVDPALTPAPATATPTAPTVAPPTPTDTPPAPTETPPPPTPAALLPAPLYVLDAAGQVQRLEVDGSTLAPVTRAAEGVTDFDVSPVTGALAYVSANALHVAGPNGEEDRILLSAPALSSDPGAARLHSLHFSPGGERIAFAGDGVYVIPTAGGEPTLVQANDPPDSPGAGTYFPVAWSPDGSRLLIERAFYTTSGMLLVKSIGFDSVTPLGSGCCEPSWSPDGRYVYLSGPYYGMRVEPGLRRHDTYNEGAKEVLVGLDLNSDLLDLFHFARLLPDDRLYSFYRQISKADYSAANAMPPFFMTRSAADGVGEVETLRDDSYALLEALWAADGSGAVIAPQPADAGAAPVLWLASDNRPAQTLPVSALVAADRRLRWGATAAALSRLSLRAQFLADTGITLAPEGTFEGFTGVGILPLAGGSEPVWAVYTQGMRSYTAETDQPHLLAIYAREAAGWRQLGLQAIGAGEDAGDPGADYLGEGSVSQAPVEPGRLWLQVEGGVGAHSGTYHLYSFAEEGFTLQAVGFSASPGAGRVEDITGEGIGEVLLDASDAYVFCYACGVRYVNTTVLRWDGAAMAPVELALLPADEASTLATLNNRAVRQAQLGLWKDALDTAGLLAAQSMADPTGIVAWNSALITLNGGEKMPPPLAEDAFPILHALFFGDYLAAVAPFRGYDATAIFATPSQVLVDREVAQGWEESIGHWVFSLSGPVITSDLATTETRAAAHFLQAWAAHLLDPADPAIAQNLTRSVELAPGDALYTAARALFD